MKTFKYDVVVHPEMLRNIREEIKDDYFKDITFRQEYPGSAHRDTETVFLRYCDQLDPQTIMNALEGFRDTLYLDKLPSIRLLLKDLGRYLGWSKLGKVLLVKLKAGGHVDAHADEGEYAVYYDRFHIPIVTNDKNTFTVANEIVRMQEGELWWFNNQLIHKAQNDSDLDRIVLIIDAKVGVKDV